MPLRFTKKITVYSFLYTCILKQGKKIYLIIALRQFLKHIMGNMLNDQVKLLSIALPCYRKLTEIISTCLVALSQAVKILLQNLIKIDDIKNYIPMF